MRAGAHQSCRVLPQKHLSASRCVCWFSSPSTGRGWAETPESWGWEGTATPWPPPGRPALSVRCPLGLAYGCSDTDSDTSPGRLSPLAVPLSALRRESV